MIVLAMATNLRTLMQLDTSRLRLVVSDVIPDDLDWASWEHSFTSLKSYWGDLFGEEDEEDSTAVLASIQGAKPSELACNRCDSTHVFIAIRSEYSRAGQFQPPRSFL